MIKILLGALFIMTLAKNSTAGTTYNNTLARQSIYPRAELSYYVNENAKNLPLHIDSITTVTGIMLLSDNTILWRYAFDTDELVNFMANEEKMTVRDFSNAVSLKYGSIAKFLRIWKENVMKPGIASMNCSTPAVRKFLNGGVTIKHAYYDKQLLLFNEITIDAMSCK
jgi:hypothetical protein